jgi:hypothetical protein
VLTPVVPGIAVVAPVLPIAVVTPLVPIAVVAAVVLETPVVPVVAVVAPVVVIGWMHNLRLQLFRTPVSPSTDRFHCPTDSSPTADENIPDKMVGYICEKN